MSSLPIDTVTDTSQSTASIRESLSHFVATDDATGYNNLSIAISHLGQLAEMGDASATAEFERLRGLAQEGDLRVVEGMADYFHFSKKNYDYVKTFEYGSVLLRKGYSYNVYRMMPMPSDCQEFGLGQALEFTGRSLQVCTDVQVMLDRHCIPETFEEESGSCCSSYTIMVENDQHFRFITVLFQRLARAFPLFLRQIEARFQDTRKPFRDLMLAIQHASSGSESDLDKAWPFLLAACKAGLPQALKEFAQPRWRTRAVNALAQATC